jgi:hypothetical protein
MAIMMRCPVLISELHIMACSCIEHDSRKRKRFWQRIITCIAKTELHSLSLSVKLNQYFNLFCEISLIIGSFYGQVFHLVYDIDSVKC